VGMGSKVCYASRQPLHEAVEPLSFGRRGQLLSVCIYRHHLRALNAAHSSQLVTQCVWYLGFWVDLSFYAPGTDVEFARGDVHHVFM
jgi:hypothetical protein